MKFSHSELRTDNECPKLHQHTYQRKMQPRKRPSYFVVGSAVHAFLDIYYATKGKDLKVAKQAAQNEFAGVNRALLTQKEVTKLEQDRAMVLGICEAYAKLYKTDFDQYEMFMTEQHAEFSFGDMKSLKGRPLGHPEPVLFHGFIDLLAKDAAGEWWIMETKTASPQSVNDDYFRRVQIDAQVHAYMWVAREILGAFPRGVIYNVIKKSNLRRRQAESLEGLQKRILKDYVAHGQEEQKFVRQEVIIGKPSLKRWYANTKAHCFGLTRRLLRGKPSSWLMRTNQCISGFGSACSMLDACIDGNYNKMLYETRKK